MSAYDNPTIIKDDSAMAWAQGMASFGENFSKARIARQAFDLKEKEYEDKLKAETKKTAIEIQKFSINQNVANQAEIGSVVDNFAKTSPNVNGLLSTQWGKKFAGILEENGMFNKQMTFEDLSKSKISEGNKLIADGKIWKDKSVSGLAAFNQNIIDWEKLSPREKANTAFMGNTALEKRISEITLYSSNQNNYNWKDKVDKKLYEEAGDITNPGIEIITKVDLAKDLEGFTEEDLQAEAKKPNGAVIVNETVIDGKPTKQYSVRFKQKLGDPSWDGTFYHKVAEWDGDTVWSNKQANILDSKNGLNNNFILNAGNPVVTKEKIKDFPNMFNEIETTYVNIPAIKLAAQMYYNMGTEALLSADLKEMTQLQSFLQTKLNRGNEKIEDWIKKYPTTKEQNQFISERLLDIDIENKLTSSSDQYSNRPATDEDVKAGRANKTGELVYYSQKAREVTAPKTTVINNNNSGGKKTESIESITKRIGNIQKGQIGVFEANGRKIAYDGANFLIERTSGLKDLVFKTKEDAINYLKQGDTSKPKP